MSFNKEQYQSIIEQLHKQEVKLVAVTKTKPVSDVLDAYAVGQLDFGENYVQELVDKENELPKDIRWHFIGHLQRNKVKQIAPFVYLIHGVDSLRLLKEINKEGIKNNRRINCLIQVHIASEETKFGFAVSEIEKVIEDYLNQKNDGLCVKGLMGMASFTDDKSQVAKEFTALSELFRKLQNDHVATEQFNPEILSIGMSGDYPIAIAAGGNMVRIGSILFGKR